MATEDVRIGKQRRDQLVEFIEQYLREQGWPPTKTEMCEALGVRTRTLEKHLAKLRDENRIETSVEWRGVRVKT